MKHTAVSTSQRPTAPADAYSMQGFVLRSPLLPLAEILDLVRNLPNVDWDSDEAFATGTSAIRARIKSLITRPEIAEAIFIASPSLAESTPIWLDNPLSARGQKVERSLFKYLSRMSTRSTPFGLFSGCSAGQMGDRTCLTLVSRREFGRHSRLDMDYLFGLTEALNHDKRFRAKLRFRPNDTLVRFGTRYRYVEPRLEGVNARRYHLVAVAATPYLERALESAAHGATPDTIATALVHYDDQIDVAEARAYVEELIDNHLLVSTLQPILTGPEPASELVAQIQMLGETEMASHLSEAINRLTSMDALGLGRSAQDYFTLLQALKPLPRPVQISRLVQVDMHKPGVVVLGPNVQSEIESYARVLGRLGSAVNQLAAFREAFEKRYGTAAIPLLEVLDEESGIGLGDVTHSDESPLVSGLHLDGARREETTPWKRRHAWMLEQLHALWIDGRTELVVTEDELEQVFGSAEQSQSPSAFSIGFSILAASAAAIDRGDFLVDLRGFIGPSGARLVGRFCHVVENLTILVRQHIREEEAEEPDSIFAEIVHLPQGRLGNIILRPVLRDYELTYLGRSGANEDRQIPLSDLFVSVRGNRILLWSARLGKRIVPRLTSAHNFTLPGTLAPYRFLALLQMDGLHGGFTWDWGPLAGSAYLPRVRWGRCILSPAKWRIRSREIQSLSGLSGKARFSAARDWARGRRLPRLVDVVDGDNELLVDLDNPLSIDAFVDLVSNRSDVTLSETLASPGELCVASPDGLFTHEIHVPVVKKRPLRDGAALIARSDSNVRLPARHEGTRNISPGSEWLFVKIYAGPSEIDRVISLAVASLVSNLTRASLIERWFFVRYQDPDSHLRLRFRGNPRVLHGEVLIRLNETLEPWLSVGTVHRMQLDTYQPELERYGGPLGLDLAEQVFQIDSEAVIELLSELEGEARAHARWLLALRGLEAMVDDFCPEPAHKRALIARRRNDYGRELNMDAIRARHALSNRYRQHRDALKMLWNPNLDATSQLAAGLATWTRRSARLRPLASRLHAVERQGVLWGPLTQIVDSCLHMYVNRITRWNGTLHEFVMFDFLKRHLESLDARARARVQHA
jgi:lantibiotic biosynthesis protein